MYTHAHTGSRWEERKNERPGRLEMAYEELQKEDGFFSTYNFWGYNSMCEVLVNPAPPTHRQRWGINNEGISQLYNLAV